MNARRFTSSNARPATRVKNLLVFAFIVLTVTACRNQNTAVSASAPPSDAATASDAAPIAALAQNSYANVVDRVVPAVVTVRSARRVRAPQQHPFMDDPLFREFFGDRMPRAPQQEPRGGRPQRGLGSGVIVSNDGTILTNHHVVDGAEEIRVELTDGRTFEAKVVGTDQLSDLAVLKVNANNLPTLTLGDSDRVRVGDVALAIGNPLDVGQTVTAGIISAKGRSTGLSDGSFEDFLQTDAPINQGNSGGALVNTNGELIGINSQIASVSGGNIGIGFAIPSNMAKNVMEQLVKTGKVRRSQLGVNIQPITSDIAASLNLREARGVIVNSISPGSAAERAGIKQGDVITAFNGQAVADGNTLRNRVAGTQPGTEVTLTIVRDGREQQVRATLNELVATANRGEQSEGNGDGQTGGGNRLGLRVEPLTPDLAARLGLPNNAQGLIVTSVDPTGPAAEAGISEGDLIESANRQSVRTEADLLNAIQRAGDRPLLLLVRNRRGQSGFLTVRPRS